MKQYDKNYDSVILNTKIIMNTLNYSIEKLTNDNIKEWIKKIDTWSLEKIWYFINKENRNKILYNLTDRTQQLIINKAEEYIFEKLSNEELIDSYEYILDSLIVFDKK